MNASNSNSFGVRPDFFVAAPHAAAVEVDRQVRDASRGRSPTRSRRLHAPQARRGCVASSSSGPNGFVDVIVGPVIERGQSCRPPAPRADRMITGTRRRLPHAPAHFAALEVGQTQIQHDQVGRRLVRMPVSAAVARHRAFAPRNRRDASNGVSPF